MANVISSRRVATLVRRTNLGRPQPSHRLAAAAAPIPRKNLAPGASTRKSGNADGARSGQRWSDLSMKDTRAQRPTRRPRQEDIPAQAPRAA